MLKFMLLRLLQLLRRALKILIDMTLDAYTMHCRALRLKAEINAVIVIIPLETLLQLHVHCCDSIDLQTDFKILLPKSPPLRPLPQAAVVDIPEIALLAAVTTVFFSPSSFLSFKTVTAKAMITP